jgi:hypothetical protein
MNALRLACEWIANKVGCPGSKECAFNNRGCDYKKRIDCWVKLFTDLANAKEADSK